jgi:Arc/MetJ-type ribon-helix-helix transcriptional regulator
MAEQNKDKKDKTEQQEKRHQRPLDEFGNQVEKFAVRTAESIRKVIDKALASRNTVLTIRVNDESNKKLNMLVEAGLFKSRSESAAFLIQEGIKIQEPLFSKITDKLEKMERIREELKAIVSKEVEVKPGKEEKKTKSQSKKAKKAASSSRKTK